MTVTPAEPHPYDIGLRFILTLLGATVPKPLRLDLNAPGALWQSADMPSANMGIDLVRLGSAPDELAILGRFPAGFERSEAGGYDVAESFIVLSGALHLEGMTASRGTLCFLPAGLSRSPMRAPQGCLVLAWFGGLAHFRPARQLTAPAEGAMSAVQIPRKEVDSPVLVTSDATWWIVHARDIDSFRGEVDVVDLALTSWARVTPGATPVMSSGPLLARVPIAATRATPL